MKETGSAGMGAGEPTGKLVRGNGQGWGGRARPTVKLPRFNKSALFRGCNSSRPEGNKFLSTIQCKHAAAQHMRWVLAGVRGAPSVCALPRLARVVKGVISGLAGTCPFFAFRQSAKHPAIGVQQRRPRREQLPDHLDPIV